MADGRRYQRAGLTYVEDEQGNVRHKWRTDSGVEHRPIRHTKESRLCMMAWLVAHALAEGKRLFVKRKDGSEFTGWVVQAPADIPLPTKPQDRIGLSNVRAVFDDGTSIAVNDMEDCRADA